MRVAYSSTVADEIIYDIIEIDENISFNFNKNSVKFWTKYDDSSGTICREYIVDDIEAIYIQTLKNGFIDLTMYEPFNKFQQFSGRHTYYLVKDGKCAKKCLDYENEDKEGIDMHIDSLKRQLSEWEQMKEDLNKELLKCVKGEE